MPVDLETLFDSYSKPTIFANKTALEIAYTPKEIPFRDSQLTQLASILAPSLRLERPSNVFLYGKTGTGKTLCIRYVTLELERKAGRQGVPLSVHYVNCKLRRVADTEYRILAEIALKLGKKVPPTGLPTEQVYSHFIDALERQAGLFIFVLDEIDQAVKKIGDNFLYNLTRLNGELERSQIAFVGISNDVTFLDRLDARVRSSLSEEEIVFPPYDAAQLSDILLKRAKVAFKSGAFERAAIAKCAAYAAKEHGDARKALNLLRVAGEIAERRHERRLCVRHVDEANEKLERDSLTEVLETQPRHFKLVLRVILDLHRKNEVHNGGNRSNIFTGDVYNAYESLCNRLGETPLTQRRVSDIISELDTLGFVNSAIVSKGRYGRMRQIRLAIPTSLFSLIYSLTNDG